MLLCDRRHVLKLSDFGTTATMRTKPTKDRGTPLYLPQHETYTAATDIYSWALCFYYVLSNVTPYVAYNNRELEDAFARVRDVYFTLF